MTADTTSPARSFEPIAARISELDAHGIEHELMPLLSGDRQGLIQDVIASGEVGSAQVVFSALEGAMEQVHGETKTILGEKVVRGVVAKLGNGDARVDSVDTALTFFDMAHSIAESIEDPKERARTIRGIASGIMRYPADYSTIEEPTKLADQAYAWFDEAAEAAGTIENPYVRAGEVASVAGASADAIEQLAERVAKAGYKADEGQSGAAQQLFDKFAQQPRRLYRDAIASSQDAKKPADRLKARANVVVSMAGSAADIAYASAFISEEMVIVAADEIAGIVSAYRNSDEYAGLPAAQKSTNLLRFGSELGAVIARKYGGPQSHLEATLPDKYNLISQTANVFKAARDFAQEIPLMGKILSHSGIARGRYTIPRGASSDALVFAGRAMGADFETGKAMLVTAFDLARVDDFGTHDTFYRDQTLSVVGQKANAPERSVKEAFELFALGHTLAGIGLANTDHRTMTRRDNAANAFFYLARTHGRDMALDKVDREYVATMVRYATGPNSTTRSDHLLSLGRYVDDRPLRHAIGVGANTLRAQEAAEAEPKNDTERIVQETLRRR